MGIRFSEVLRAMYEGEALAREKTLEPGAKEAGEAALTLAFALHYVCERYGLDINKLLEATNTTHEKLIELGGSLASNLEFPRQSTPLKSINAIQEKHDPTYDPPPRY